MEGSTDSETRGVKAASEKLSEDLQPVGSIQCTSVFPGVKCQYLFLQRLSFIQVTLSRSKLSCSNWTRSLDLEDVSPLIQEILSS